MSITGIAVLLSLIIAIIGLLVLEKETLAAAPVWVKVKRDKR